MVNNYKISLKTKNHFQLGHYGETEDRGEKKMTK